MNSKFKKIITATLITTASAAMIGCGTANNKLAKNIDKGMAEFVTSINNLDYVDTASDAKLGKIVETAAVANTLDDQYLTQTLEELNVDNAITLPSERTDNFKLFVLSNEPFISFTSSDNTATVNMQLNFSTAKISDASNEINDKINNLILKRSILMIYVNEIYNNRVNLSDENRVAINAYVNVIKENASFLSGNRGMVKNQLTLASDLMSNNSNDNLVNYYMIKSGEALETRSSKIDSTISAINSIIEIIEINLDASSIYYQSSLSTTYENIIENLKTSANISAASTENKELADNIANSLNICEDCNEIQNQVNKISSTQDNNNTLTNNTTLNSRNITNSITNDQTNSNNIKNQNTRKNRNLQPNKNTNQSNNQKTINQNNTLNQNNSNSKNISNSQNQNNSTNKTLKNNQNQSILKNKNNALNTRSQTSLSQNNNDITRSAKNANLPQSNQKTRLNLQNNENLYQNSTLKNTPSTLDIPRENFMYLQNQQDTFDIERNNRQNQTEVNSQTNLLENSNSRQQNNNTNARTSNNINRKRHTSNPQINNTHENIKRVPYIGTLD